MRELSMGLILLKSWLDKTGDQESLPPLGLSWQRTVKGSRKGKGAYGEERVRASLAGQ